MAAVRIEYAQRTHAREIAAVEARSVEAFGHLLTRVPEIRMRDTGVRLVALREQRVTGYLAGVWRYLVTAKGGRGDRTLWISVLAVDAPDHGVGIVLRLLMAVTERGRARGARSLHLMVPVESSPSIELYESAGFERSERRVGAYGQRCDGIVMMLPVGAGDHGGS